MTNFYVPLEIKNRDFFGRLLLSLEVCKKFGWDIYFGFRGDVNHFAKFYQPGIYYGLATVKNFEKLYKEIKNNGNLISIIDEEGLVTYAEKYYSSFKVSNNNLNLSDLIFVWGEKNKKVLQKTISEKKIVVSGNPRLDMLKYPFNSIYKHEIEMIKKKYGKFFLICTNFSYTNYFEKNIKYSDLLKKRKFFTCESDLNEWYKYENIKKNIFDELSKFLSKSHQITNVSFIIRCHPSENIEIYEEFQKKYKNVFLDNSYSVHPWILASEGIINHYCTTTFEALIAKKKIYTIKPKYQTNLEDPIFFEPTIIAENHDKLLSVLKENIETKIQEHAYYCSKDFSNNHLSFLVIADELGKLNHQHLEKKLRNNFILKYKIIKILRFIKDKIFLRSNTYVDHKIKNIEKHEIDNFISNYEKYKKSIKVKKICKNFFLLSNAKN